MAEYTTIEEEYQRSVEELRDSCMEYPNFVTIETLALCNAACNFCPYPTMERKGDKMPTAVFEKIIADLTDIPKDHGFSMHLSRVNEPFLDSRIFDFYRMINQNLPQAKVCFFSNASVMTENKIDQLLDITNVEFFVISLNEYRHQEYEQVMKIPFDRTIKHIDALHKRKLDGAFSFPVVLSRVGDGSECDREFVLWCEQRYPEFVVSVRPRGDWMGLTTTQWEYIPQAGCRQWFQLHLLADGRDTFCCIDAEGQYGFNQNAKLTHVLDIYNSPQRKAIRESIRSRTELPLCASCTMYP